MILFDAMARASVSLRKTRWDRAGTDEIRKVDVGFGEEHASNVVLEAIKRDKLKAKAGRRAFW